MTWHVTCGVVSNGCLDHAFDKVGHQRLIKNLDYYPVRDKTSQARRWIQVFLANQTQKLLPSSVSQNTKRWNLNL